jgi:phosphate transport system substrate-binding protein
MNVEIHIAKGISTHFSQSQGSSLPHRLAPSVPKVVALVLGCVLCALVAQAQAPLRLHGAVVLKGIIDPQLTGLTASTALKLELVGNGADNGLLDLVEGRADVAMLSAPIEDIAEKINAKKPGTVDTAKLKEIKLGTSRIALVVHPGNPVKKLSNAQAVDLLSGKIKNWKEVGGADQAVVVVVAPSGNGTRTAVEKQLLKTATFAPDARVVPSPLQVPIVVAQLPGAIGPLGASVLSGKVAAVALESEIQTEMSFAVKGEASADVQKLVEAVKPLIK